jgi:flagellar biosynthetic protein FliP
MSRLPGNAVHRFLVAALAGMLLVVASPSHTAAQELELPGVTVEVTGTDQEEVATAIKILLGLTVLSLAPAILVVMTSFTRIIIVLSILRHALAMQQTPPNTVLISLALILTVFNMLPVFESAYATAYQPYMDDQLTTQAALQEGLVPFRHFMVSQMREQDLGLMVELSGRDRPQTIADIGTVQLVPAFLLSELKTAFQIGFVLFLPFLLIDIVVASILMSMGMLMVPPMMISLPIKILMFVLIDGWYLVVSSLMGSFN